MKRGLDELVDKGDPGIALVREWAAASERPVEMLSADPAAGERTLLALQVSTRSPLGAVAHETGGIVVDGGWLRILGAGSPGLTRSVSDWNRIDKSSVDHRLPGALLIADDAMGGFFAINGGRFSGQPGAVFYLAPDTCRWEDLELGYTDWLSWVLSGDLPGFYDTIRWPGWEGEVSALRRDQCISVVPFLWADGGAIEKRSRRPVPIEETWGLHAIEFPKQLDG